MGAKTVSVEEIRRRLAHIESESGEVERFIPLLREKYGEQVCVVDAANFFGSFHCRRAGSSERCWRRSWGSGC